MKLSDFRLQLQRCKDFVIRVKLEVWANNVSVEHIARELCSAAGVDYTAGVLQKTRVTFQAGDKTAPHVVILFTSKEFYDKVSVLTSVDVKSGTRTLKLEVSNNLSSLAWVPRKDPDKVLVAKGLLPFALETFLLRTRRYLKFDDEKVVVSDLGNISITVNSVIAVLPKSFYFKSDEFELGCHVSLHFRGYTDDDLLKILDVDKEPTTHLQSRWVGMAKPIAPVTPAATANAQKPKPLQPPFCDFCKKAGHVKSACADFKTWLANLECRRCYEKGHSMRFCKNEMKCRRCKEPGHFAFQLSKCKLSGQFRPERPREQHDESGSEADSREALSEVEENPSTPSETGSGSESESGSEPEAPPPAAFMAPELDEGWSTVPRKATPSRRHLESAQRSLAVSRPLGGLPQDGVYGAFAALLGAEGTSLGQENPAPGRGNVVSPSSRGGSLLLPSWSNHG